MKKAMIDENDANFVVIHDGVGNRTEARLPSPAWKVLGLNAAVVILCDPDHPDATNRNMYGYSWDGVRLWQIPEHWTIRKDWPYVGLGVQDGMVHATNWDGGVLLVDPASGTVVGTDFTK